ncbi:MAG: imidazolonepropionase [Bacillota bacterium]
MKRQPVDFILSGAGQLVTLAGPSRPRTGAAMQAVGVIPDGALAAREGTIVAIGPSHEVETNCQLVPGGTRVDAAGRTVTPGLVDPHTHLPFYGYREDEFALRLAGAKYLEILKVGGGILSTVEKTRRASLKELIEFNRILLDRMLACGTTTIEGKSGYGLDLATERKQLQALEILNQSHPVEIVATFLGAHAVPRNEDPETYVNRVIGMLPEVRGLAEFCDVFCEEGVFSVEQARRVLIAAREHGFGLKIHADELSPLGGAELAAELGAVSAEHLLRASEDGLRQMAAAGVVACLLPGTPFTLGHDDYAPARRMIELGVTVALATDCNPGTCFTESMPMVMAIACRRMKLSPEEALTAATINAAHAIGRGDTIGSLEPGKQADLVIFDMPNYRHLPYHYGVNLVATVIKRGRVVYDRTA